MTNTGRTSVSYLHFLLEYFTKEQNEQSFEKREGKNLGGLRKDAKAGILSARS